MKIAILQFSPIWESKKQSMDLLNDKAESIQKGTDLLVLPEMTLTGFTMNSKEFAEEIDGTSVKYFMELSRKHKVDVIAGIIEKENKNYFNSLFHFDKGGLIKAVYRKIHPFSLADEDKNFTRGDEIVLSTIGKSNLGLTICYDLRFPELYRLKTKKGAEVLINIANWPIKRIEHWKILLRSRAIENQCYMIGVNRIGNDPFQTYNGCSAVIDPMGEIVLSLKDENTFQYAELNLDYVKEVRTKLNFLNDMKLI